MQRTQALDFVVDIARLHRTTAWTVNAQHNTLGIGVFKRVTQRTNQIVGTGLLLISNHTA